MKVLLISDDENFTTNCSSFFESKDFDVIVYKWLLKALDNIEEIKPDIIILSTGEYPRHWKTLVQFVKSGIGGNECKFYLYEPNPLSEEDTDKVKFLGIEGVFADVNELSSLFYDGSDEIDDIPSVSQIVQENSETVEGNIIFTNPITHSFITGTFNKEENTLNCILDFDLDIPQGTKIDKVTYTANNDIKYLEATVTSVEKNLLSLEINKYYEEI